MLATYWNDQGARRNLNSAQQTLEEQRQLKLDDMTHKAASLWIQMGDKCSKAYFDFQRGPTKRSLISKLHHDGKPLNTPHEIQGAISEYYYNLYSKDEMVDANIQTRRECFTSVPKIVSEDQNNFLIQPFTKVD